MHHKSITLTIIVLAILASVTFSACSTKKTSGQLIMDVTGESFPIYKTGTFNKNHDFWVFQIRDVARTSKQRTSLALKGAGLETTSRAVGFKLIDPAGYEWDIVTVAELKRARGANESRKDSNVVSYTYASHMEEINTMVNRRIRASFIPADSTFDGSLRGEILNDKNEVLFTFESNARLDTYDNPDEGLQVFSIAKNDKTVAVLDSRNGYEVTFFEGLLPTERTQLAGTISSLFMLMRYGGI